MTDDETPTWPPTAMAEQFQAASEDAVERQTEFVRRMLDTGSGSSLSGLPGLAASSMGTATFKTRVQSGGRLSIPDAEREALDIAEGDIVQTVVVPVTRDREDSA